MKKGNRGKAAGGDNGNGLIFSLRHSREILEHAEQLGRIKPEQRKLFLGGCPDEERFEERLRRVHPSVRRSSVIASLERIIETLEEEGGLGAIA